LRTYLSLDGFWYRISLGEKCLQPVAGISRYLQRIRSFNRNAKLYLVATVFQGLGSGIWAVLFYLYLNLHAVGFHMNFIGNMFTVGAIATGLVALPAGLLCERIGPKKAILIGLGSNLISIAEIVVLQPAGLLFASVTSNLVATLGSVSSAKFMAENCNPEERTYLFSVQSTLSTIMAVVGSLVGGFMPDLFNAAMKLSIGTNGSAVGYRLSLAIGIALSFSVVIPVLFIKENRKCEQQEKTNHPNSRRIRSSRTMLKFMIPTALIGLGAGFVVPLVNPFFANRYGATPEQVGVISSLGNITLGVAILATPALSKRLTKAKFVAVCQYLSMPFIMLTSLSPNLTWAGGSYIVRTSLMNVSGPIGTTLQMDLVAPSERATISGLLTMSDSIPRSIAASASGALMTGGDYFTPFLYMTITYFVATSLYLSFFKNAEKRVPAPQNIANA